MQAQVNKVVSFHYQMFDMEGQLVEQSDPHQPAVYLHGHNNMMAALESALEGKSVGDKLEVELEAKDAYGERKQMEPVRVPIKHLISAPKKLKPGMMVKVNTDNGASAATVVKVGRFNVDLDTNHPLAGKKLRFDVEVVEVRDASSEEVAHGHVHGPGGHHH